MGDTCPMKKGKGIRPGDYKQKVCQDANNSASQSPSKSPGPAKPRSGPQKNPKPGNNKTPKGCCALFNLCAQLGRVNNHGHTCVKGISKLFFNYQLNYDSHFYPIFVNVH